MARIRTHYDNLKVSRDAPAAVIRAAYKTLTQQYHPDKNPADERAAKIMQLINASYEVLSDPARRQRHDEWIREQEAGEAGGEPARPASSGAAEPRASARAAPQTLQVPALGSCAVAELSTNGVAAMRELMAGKAEHQALAPLATKTWQVWLLAGAVAFLGYMVYDSLKFRWSASTAWWYGAWSVAAGALALYCGFYLWRWYRSTLRPSLVVTPLYLMLTDYTRVRFWPLSDVEDVRVTHHTYNGAHSYTTVVMKLAGHWRNFRIVERRHFDVFAESFGRFRGALKQAAETGNQRFVDRFDVFADSRRSVPPRVSFGFLAPLMAAALGGLLGYGVYAGAAAPNAALAYHQAVPYTAAPAPTDAASGRRRQVAPAPSEPRKDHLEAHLGKATPTAAGYIAGERRLRTNGLSTVTVDNGQNGADVLVKLVTLDAEPSYPVRVFYIPAHGSFTVKDVAPGRYDVRYLERWSGEMARSDPFTLSQTQRGGGIEYDQMTLTLYKVQNGNMQTHTINESEF